MRQRRKLAQPVARPDAQRDAPVDAHHAGTQLKALARASRYWDAAWGTITAPVLSADPATQVWGDIDPFDTGGTLCKWVAPAASAVSAAARGRCLTDISYLTASVGMAKRLFSDAAANYIMRFHMRSVCFENEQARRSPLHPVRRAVWLTHVALVALRLSRLLCSPSMHDQARRMGNSDCEDTASDCGPPLALQSSAQTAAWCSGRWYDVWSGTKFQLVDLCYTIYGQNARGQPRKWGCGHQLPSGAPSGAARTVQAAANSSIAPPQVASRLVSPAQIASAEADAEALPSAFPYEVADRAINSAADLMLVDNLYNAEGQEKWASHALWCARRARPASARRVRAET